jgi:peptidoglycan/LPS O-acetylase OafA/YrhL
MTDGNSQRVHYPYIDGLRAIAVLSVMAYHLNPVWLPGGFAGVDVFFVISGFVVSMSVGSLHGMRLAQFIAYFYARRIQRIGPALVVCLLVTAFVTALLIPPAWLSAANQQTGLYAFFGLSNFILARTSNDYFSPTAEFNPYTHTWSLGIEEQFYFIFPLLFFAWTWSGKWRRAAFWLFLAGILVSVAIAAWLANGHKTFAFYMIVSRFWELGAGVALYQLLALSGHRFDGAMRQSTALRSAMGVASLALLVLGFYISRPGSFPFPGAIIPVLGTLGLLGFVHGQEARSLLPRLLTTHGMRFIGKISYSLYLWHWPVFVLFKWTLGLDSGALRLAAVMLALGLAVVSYFWVELPIRRQPRLHRMPRAAVCALGLAMLATTAALSSFIDSIQSGISISTVVHNADNWYPTGADSSSDFPGCKIQASHSTLNGVSVTAFMRENCNQMVAGKTRLFVVGDSHTLAYHGMIKRYILETGAVAFFYKNGGCPYMGFQSQRENDDVNCRTHVQASTADLLSKIRPGDIVFLPSLRLPRYSTQWDRINDSKAYVEMFGASAVAGRSAAEEIALPILRAMNEKGAKIVFEAPKPVFKAPPFRCADRYSASNPVCGGGLQMLKAELEQFRKPVMESINRLVAAVPGVTVWDPFPALCPGTTCEAVVAGVPLFFDGDHISGYGNRVLLPSFRQYMVELGGR